MIVKTIVKKNSLNVLHQKAFSRSVSSFLPISFGSFCVCIYESRQQKKQKGTVLSNINEDKNCVPPK